MAKTASAKKSAPATKKFSVKALHAEFNRTRRRLNSLGKTASQKKLLQNLNVAQAMVECPQGMLLDLSK